MAEERVRWRAKHDALAIELEQSKRDLTEALANAALFAKENDALRDTIAELKKAVERARLQGMNDVTGLLLRNGQ